jgi:tetratricopeptide (TPR) repeat protein
MTFFNPERRQREGRFTITLPPGAAVSRFAMKLRDEWQDARMVERQQARKIYEDYLHRDEDPALLEKKAGNQFRARVFPIPPVSEKEILIAYTQLLPSSRSPYRLFLRGLPTVGRIELFARLGSRSFHFRRTHHAPRADWVVPVEAASNGLRHRNLALMRVTPELPVKRAAMSSLLLLFDTSASRAPGFQRQVKRLGRLVEGIRRRYGDSLPLHLACFDQGVSTIYRGAIGRLDRTDLDAILVRRPLGASNLHAALSWARGTGHRGGRLVLITDGVPTAGSSRPDQLQQAVKALTGQVSRLDVVLVGGIRDEAAMRLLSSGNLERDGAVLDGEERVDVLSDRLSRAVVSGVKVVVPGAKWSWPRELPSMQPGDQALVYADLPPDEPMVVHLEGPIRQRIKGSPAPSERPGLERAFVEVRIRDLERQRARSGSAELRRGLRERIVALSVEHGVLSDHTAWLVLESEAEYARYGINERRAQPAVRPRVPRVPPPRRRRWTGGGGGGGGGGRTMSAGGRKTVYDFDDDIVEGELIKPDGALLSARRIRYNSLLRLTQPRGLSWFLRPGDEYIHVALPRYRRRPAPQGRVVVPASPPPLRGRLARVTALCRGGQREQALVEALRWRAEQPGNILALVALGEVLEAHGAAALAARVWGSIIDLYPSRADKRRFAAERLEGLGRRGLALAVDSFAEAARRRPDHGLGHHQLGLALARRGQLQRALEALERGLDAIRKARIRRPGLERILREDLGLVAAALAARDPERRAALAERLRRHGARLASGPSLRFLLGWQTDVNDVDLHVHDGRGGHAYHRARRLDSGGALYADVRNGYGPECFTVKRRPAAFPYRLRVHYYSRGPMGYGVGKVLILAHDGQGKLTFLDRPFLVMNDGAFVELGELKRLP